MIKGLSGMTIALAAAALTTTLVVNSTTAVGQGQAAYRAPRASDGHPDLSGIWQAMNTANYDVEAHVARPAMALRTGPYGPLPAAPVLALGAIGSVPGGLGVIDGGGEIPYKPEMLARRKENQEKWLERDPEIKCYLPGIPRANYMPFPFQIFQNKEQILIVHEYKGSMRTVFMEKHQEAPVDSWMGWSNGRWEGDTLVIDVTGFNGHQWLDRAGNFFSDTAHVVERWTRRDADHLNYEATIEDPAVFTRPWKVSFPIYRRIEPNMQLVEFNCVPFVEEMMYAPIGLYNPPNRSSR
jgi:hypothetical protein